MDNRTQEQQQASTSKPQEVSRETSSLVVKESTVAEESVVTQVSTEEDTEMNPNCDDGHNDNNNNNDDANGNNPLFKLVNAAASMIMEPSEENDTKDESQQEEEQNDDHASPTTGDETSEKPNSLATIELAATSKSTADATTAEDNKPSTSSRADGSANNDDSSKPSSPSSKPKSPTPNVIQGTKEDLMLDPKIKLSFAEHLYNVLENPEHHDVLNWMPDGLSFTVVNHKKFVLQKMPTLFQIRNMSSFVRKLGRWGFSRVFEKETNNSDVFKHPHFHRGDRLGVRKHVKCLGRAAGPKAQQQKAGVLTRQPDFVVRQEPGKPPIVMPTASNTAPNPLHQAALEQHLMKARSLSATGGFTSASIGLPLMHGGYGVGGLDEVTNASAASAEALYLSHQQSQKAKMEQLAASDQQRLEDLEIERLMKRRELRQQQKMQQRLFLEQHQQRRYLMEQQQQQDGGGLGGSHRGISSFGGVGGGSSAMMMDTSGSSAHMDASQRSSNMLMQQYHQGGMSSSGITYLPTHDDLRRRVSMQHPSGSLDGSLGRSASSRYSTTLNDVPTLPQVTPTYDTRKVLGAAYETLQRDEMRSRERQAAIRALLAEEQEFEARRSRAMGGGGPTNSFGANNLRG